MDLNGSLTTYAIQLQQAAYTYLHAVYTNYEVPSHIVQWVYDFVKAHGSALIHIDHSSANSIFIHPMYGSARLPDQVHFTAATGCLHILVGAVVVCLLGVGFS